VIRFWGQQNNKQAVNQILAEWKKGNVRISKHMLASYSDVPLGSFQTEHASYRCAIECPSMNVEDSVVVDRAHARRIR
jgi:hypothetical protein